MDMFTPKINRAIRIAALAHDGQFRREAKVPYLAHPVAVALITQRYVPEEDVFVAALLHDVLEDAPEKYSAEQLREDFGSEVLKIVEDVTEPIDQTTWRARKEGYLKQLSHPQSSKSIIVAMADKIHNMSEMIRTYTERGDAVWKLFWADKADEYWLFDEVHKIAVAQHAPAAAIQEYERLLAQLRQIAL